MECLGGNGYVEADGEGVMARIYREMPLNTHLGRRRQHHGAGPAARAARRRRRRRRSSTSCAARAARTPPSTAAPTRLLAQIDGAHAGSRRRAGWRATWRCCCRPRCCSRQAPPAVFDAFCASRLAGASDVFGLLPARHDLDALIARAMPQEH